MSSTTTPSISTADHLSALATRYPAASRVFMRHNLDYCCGGKRSLADACDAAQIDVQTVLAEINAEFTPADENERQWDQAPLADLIDHILSVYHAPHKEELPRLVAMAKKVFDVHGAKDARLAPLLETVADLSEELFSHMAKEEEVLFPMIRAGNGAMAGMPIQVMTSEHDSAGEALGKIRELTDTFQPPAGACTTWRALWKSLEEFDAALREHIHLENNILFPRALIA